jgi:hypothetical protein
MDHWHSILEEWILCTERFSRLWNGEETSYLYKEVSNVGTLAAAAWKAGFISSQGIRLEKKKGKENRLGRGDLYIGSDIGDEWIEAKFSWLSIDKKRSAAECLSKTLGAALEAASECREHDDEDLRGCAFFGLKQKTGKIEKIDVDIARVVREFLDQDVSIVAWCFPKENREREFDGLIFPGVILTVENEANDTWRTPR